MTPAEALAAATTPQEAASASASLLAEIDLLIARAQVGAAIRLDAARACAGAATAVTDQALAAARDALGEAGQLVTWPASNRRSAASSAACRRTTSRRCRGELRPGELFREQDRAQLRGIRPARFQGLPEHLLGGLPY